MMQNLFKMNVMTNILKYTFAAGAAVLMLASCDLNLTPESAIAYEEGKRLFVSESDITAFDNGLHASFRAMFYGANSQTSEIMCDGFNATVNYNNHYGAEHMANETFNAGSQYVETVWANNYGAIKNYNIAIANADNVDPSLRAAARYLKGDGYFYRACSYLTLARHFAKAYDASTAGTDLCVPLVLVYNQLEKPARATVKAVYDQIKADLDSAAVIFAKVEGEARAMAPTIDAVNAVYARYFLDTKNYQMAAQYAEKVISTNHYALASTDADMAKEYTEDAGTEPIMQMYASKQEGTAANQMYMGEGGVGSDATGKYFSSYYIPTQVLINSYDAGDVRKAAWFATDMYLFKANGARYKGITVFAKYLGNPALYTGNDNGAQAVKPLLIGEQYLIAAEAHLQAGDAGKAKTYLNALQEKRGAVKTEATMANIKKEWFRETVGEGLRMSCLKRWGDPAGIRTPQTAASDAHILMTGPYYEQRVLAATDYHFCWPIPEYEIKVNNNLVQNDGYSL